MKEESLKELTKMLLNYLPKEKKVSGKKQIQAFEKMLEELPRGVTLHDLAAPAYDAQHPMLEELNVFFKAVHAVIRAKVLKKTSLIDKALEEVLLSNFRNASDIIFTKEEGIQALNIVLDWYDPNKNQGFERHLFNWEGFTSIVTTKDGLISEVTLLEQVNREMFYDALYSFKNLKDFEEKQTSPSQKTAKKAKVFINKKRS
jgi:hypothetical protein